MQQKGNGRYPGGATMAGVASNHLYAYNKRTLDLELRRLPRGEEEESPHFIKI